MGRLYLLTISLAAFLTVATASQVSFVRLPSYLKLSSQGVVSINGDDSLSIIKGIAGMPAENQISGIEVVKTGWKSPKNFVFLPFDSAELQMQSADTFQTTSPVDIKKLFSDVTAFYGENVNVIDMSSDASEEPQQASLTLSEVDELLKSISVNHHKGPVFVLAPEMALAPGTEELMQGFVENLASSLGEDFVVVAVGSKTGTSSYGAIRVKRQAEEKPDATGEPSPKQLNVGISYRDDYPVIFNIILWFMIAMGLTIASVAYCIWFMDPGKDGIIYRMTASRVKKDL